MKKAIIFIAALSLIAVACEKEFPEKDVMYRVTGLELPYKVTYMDEEGNSVSEEITPTSTGDVWSTSFIGQQGDILYLYLEYFDIDPPDDKFRMSIYVDNKMYRYADEYDRETQIMTIDTTVVPHDTTFTPIFYAKRNGIIPY